MPPLVPAPSSLHLASPALGPWFRHASATPPTLPLPGRHLNVDITLNQDMEWGAPALGLRSYLSVTATRVPALRGLRRADGEQAFTPGNFVVLFNLLPEVELRLWNLTQPLAQPDGSAAPAANTPTRPRVRSFALEIAGSTVNSITALENLRPNTPDYPSDATTDDLRANFLGLTFSGSTFGNASNPVSELIHPSTSREAILENKTGSPLPVSLWCFDYRGRAVDPGAVAAWWTQMATPALWSNLWENTATADQRTATVAPGRVVHFVSPHEGPLSADIRARLTLTDLAEVDSVDYLYTTSGPAPAVALTAAPSPDTMPLPRIAALPNGNYTTPATATPFAGWTNAGTPFPMARDYMRVGVVDMESHTVGLTRADAAQADPRRRVTPQRNTSGAPVLFNTDAVNTAAMNALQAGASAIAMTPVMDTHWGANVPAALTGTDPLPSTLVFDVFKLAGEGATTTASATDQKIVLRFDAGSVPADAWIRVWTHGRDTTTGRRFRMDGGAGRSDAMGLAYVVLPLPDGTRGSDDPATPVPLSCDVLVVTSSGSRIYTDVRFDRPDVATGSKVTLPAPPGTPPNTTLWIPEQAVTLNRGTAQLRSGEQVLVVPDDPATVDFALVDPASIDGTDRSALTVSNAATTGDTLITTDPAFAQSPDGTMSETAGPNGSTRVHRSRNALTDAATMGRPAPSQERLELVALERTGNTAALGGTPAREKYHEFPTPQLSHPGVPAAKEIHGPGLALDGPVTDQIVPLMTERQSTDLVQFLTTAGTPIMAVADPGGTSAWTAVLETLTFGVTGDGIIRAYVAAPGSHTPGQDWLDLKNDIESRTGQDIDTLIDTATFNDNALATAVDSMIAKTENGLAQFAMSAQAAIARAEDFVYIQTPAIDPHTAGSGAIDLIGAITARWAQRPDLAVILCVPEAWLPDTTAKVEEVRKAGISAALKSLQDTGGDRVVLFSPTAGSGRKLHMATSLVVVDDALLLLGSTHLWRRGLTFDSSLAGALFDERVAVGRPASVRAARLQFMATMLGLPVAMMPDDPQDCLDGLSQLIRGSGMGRIKPGAYAAKADPTSSADLSIWNPDGRPGVTSDWFLFFAALTGGAATDVNGAIR